MSTSETVGGAMAPAIDQDVLQYIKDLAIADPVAAFPRSRSLSAVAEDVEQSFINDKSIVSFVSGVSSQARKDILNATLLAQLAAKKKYPDDLQVLEWYREFINVLTTIGWNVQGSEISVFKTKGDIF
ncbi:MAG TPA: hypothetical protein VFZ78_08670, partial [Flavisolibacter sp.]